MSNDRNIEQDRKYWYAKGQWNGGWKVFWVCFIAHIIATILTYGGNK